MVDTLLIQPPIRDFYFTFKRTIPYGLSLIAAALRRDGFDAAIFDALAVAKSKIIELPAEMEYIREFHRRPDQSPTALFYDYRHFGHSFEHIGKIAGESGAFLVGISSLFTPYFQEVLQTAQTVKKSLPDCLVVVGGGHPTLFPRQVMEHEEIDMVVRGEGEEAMPLLAKALKRGSPLEEVPGVVFRRTGGSLHISPPAALKHPAEDLLPAADLIKRKFYQRSGKASAVIVAARGCPLKCSYCSMGASSLVKYRRRSVGSVLRELEAAVNNHGSGFVDFEDENLSLNREWFMELMKAVVQKFGERRMELRAMNGLLPSSLDEEMIVLMKRAGFKTLNLSLCSRSPESLRRLKRPNVSDSFDRVLIWAEKHGLKATGYILIGAPYQKPDDSLNDILSLADKKVLGTVSVFYPAPGSSDYELCRELGVLPNHFSLMRSSLAPVSRATTRPQSITLSRLSGILNFIKQLLDMKLIEPNFLNRGRLSENIRYFPSVKIDQNRSSIAPIQNKYRAQRLQWGIKLLEKFLEDGKIRGIDRGEIFEHQADSDLTDKFIRGLNKLRLRGT